MLSVNGALTLSDLLLLLMMLLLDATSLVHLLKLSYHVWHNLLGGTSLSIVSRFLLRSRSNSSSESSFKDLLDIAKLTVDIAEVETTLKFHLMRSSLSIESA